MVKDTNLNSIKFLENIMIIEKLSFIFMKMRIFTFWLCTKLFDVIIEYQKWKKWKEMFHQVAIDGTFPALCYV